MSPKYINIFLPAVNPKELIIRKKVNFNDKFLTVPYNNKFNKLKT